MRKILGLVGVLLLSAVTAVAHEGKGPHGGPVADAGKFFVELVTASDQLQVYVFEDASGNPVSVKGAKGTAILLVGDQKETVTLAPTDDDKNLTGKAAVVPTAGARVVVMIQLADQPSIVGRLAL
jgi:FlaG/FlaF family flagellin (archaellin)